MDPQFIPSSFSSESAVHFLPKEKKVFNGYKKHLVNFPGVQLFDFKTGS